VFSGGVPLFNKGDRLNTSPETTAGASAAYSFPLGARAYADSWRLRPTTPHRPFGRGTHQVGAGDRMVIGRVGVSVESPDHWTATLFVNNVSNEQRR